MKSWTLPPVSTLTPQWLFAVVEWAVMIAVAVTGSPLVRRRWREPSSQGGAFIRPG